MRDRYPLVSFILTSYNYAHLIANCVASILAQRYGNLELIVADDASTDGTLDALAPFRADPRVRIFVNERNLGLIENYRAAAARATGEFITAGSPDETYLPNHVERLIAPALDPARPADFVWGNIFHVVPGGGGFSYQQYHAAYFPTDGRNDYAHLLCDFYVCGGSTLFRRADYEALGAADPYFKACSEFELPLRFARAGKRVAHVPFPTTTYLVHPDQYSRTQTYRDRLYAEYLEMLERYAVPEAAWRFRGYEIRMLEKLAELDGYPEPALRAELAPKRAALERRLRDFALGPPPPRPSEAPRVTILAVCDASYDAVRVFIAAAETQTYADWELVIYQYGLVSLEGLAQHAGSAAKIRHIHVPGIDAGTAWQQAIEHARGEIVTYFEEGAEIAPTHLATLIDALDRTGAHAVVAPTELCLHDESGPFATARDAGDVAVGSLCARAAIAHRFDVFNHLPRVERARAPFYRARAPFEVWEFLLRLRRAGLDVRSTDEAPLRLHVDARGVFAEWTRTARASRLPSMMGLYREYPAADAAIEDARMEYLARLDAWARANERATYSTDAARRLAEAIAPARAVTA